MTRNVDSDRHEIRERKGDYKTRIYVSGSGKTASFRDTVEAKKRRHDQPQYEKVWDKQRNTFQDVNEKVHRATTIS